MAEVADVFKALGDPTRLKIVQMLAKNGELCVCVLAGELGMHQPSVSHHLATLKHAELVEVRRQGQWMHYSLNCRTLTDIVRPCILALLERQDIRSALADNCCCNEVSS